MPTITRAFTGDGDRYIFDFNLCHYKKGWAQVDTTQDAWYYGNWINPLTLELMSYAEGDVTRTVCENEAEFVQAVHEQVTWQKENGYFKGIDPMCHQPIIDAFERMELKEFLH